MLFKLIGQDAYSFNIMKYNTVQRLAVYFYNKYPKIADQMGVNAFTGLCFDYGIENVLSDFVESK